MKTPEEFSTLKAWKWLVPYIKTHRKWFALSLLAAAVVVAANLLKAFAMQEVLDGAISATSRPLVSSTLLFLATILVGACFSRLRTYYKGAFAHNSARDLRDGLAHNLANTSYRNIAALQAGDMAARLNNDVGTVHLLLKDVLPDFALQASLGLAAAMYLALVEWKLLVLSLTVAPPLMLAANWLNKQAGLYYPKSAELVGAAAGDAEESLQGLETVKTFGLERLQVAKLQQKFEAVSQAEVKAHVYIALIQPVCLTLAWTPRLICTVYGGYLATQGAITPGIILLAVQLLEYISAPLVYLPFIMNRINRSIAAIGRVDNALQLPLERRDGHVLQLDELAAEEVVHFDHVSFSYEPNKETLSGVSFTLKRSQVTAIVGSSGSGKSTIANLLSGLHEYEGAGIRIFGTDIRSLSLAALREKVAVVSQEVYLFPGTVAENIRLGRSNATDLEVQQAARAALAEEFIAKLPAGYETLVGAGGIELSGGERQRLAIARALLRDAPLVILDEPTSALDNQSQAFIQRSLERLMEGRSVLVISHRFSTIAQADEILALEDGRIVERGSHSELLARQGRYYDLYHRQLDVEQEVAV